MTKMCPNGYFVTTCSLLLSLATAAWSVDSSAAETWVSEPTARLQHPYIYFRAAAAARRGAQLCVGGARLRHTAARTVRWWMLGRMGSSKACFIQYERSNVDPKSLSLLHCCCCCYCYHHPPPPPPPRYCYQHPRTTIVDAPKRFWVRHALLTHCYCIPRLLPLITLYLPLWS